MNFIFQNAADGISFSLDLARSPCQAAGCAALAYQEMCPSHLDSELGLRIAPSSIAGAGDGLWTTRPRKPHDLIAQYTGETMTDVQCTARYGPRATAPYALEVARNTVIDAAGRRCAGAYANHRPLGRANCRFTRRKDGTVWISACRRIRPDTELFVSYGRAYRMHQAGVSHATSEGAT